MPTKKKSMVAAVAPAKPVAKKPARTATGPGGKAVKKSSKPQAAKKQMLVLDNTPVLMQETEVHKPNHTIEIHRKFVLVGSCSHCEHMPMHAGKLVALLSVLIAVLSVMLLVQSGALDLSALQYALVY